MTLSSSPAYWQAIFICILKGSPKTILNSVIYRAVLFVSSFVYLVGVCSDCLTHLGLGFHREANYNLCPRNKQNSSSKVEELAGYFGTCRSNVYLSSHRVPSRTMVANASVSSTYKDGMVQ